MTREEFNRLGTESNTYLFQLARNIEQLTASHRASHHDIAAARVRASFSDVALSGRSSGVAGQGGLPGAGGGREPAFCQVLCTVVSLACLVTQHFCHVVASMWSSAGTL